MFIMSAVVQRIRSAPSPSSFVLGEGQSCCILNNGCVLFLRIVIGTCYTLHLVVQIVFVTTWKLIVTMETATNYSAIVVHA